jgi:hypothetical protein
MSQSRPAGRGGLRTALPPDTSLTPARSADYERARDLPKLLPLWAWELKTPSKAEHARLLARLRRALRAERQRGLGGHWTYDLARHAQLLRAYRAEVAAGLGEESSAVRAPGDGEVT